MILVASKNKDFADLVSEQVRNVLKLPCAVKHSIEGLNQLDSGVKLVISDRHVEVPVALVVPQRIPFRISEILTKVQSALQVAAHEMPIALPGGYRLTVRSKQLAHTVSGSNVLLTDKEVQLLLAIHQAGNAGLEKEELLKTVWGFEPEVNTHTLETHVYRLRAKFRELSGRDEGIATSDGKYRLSA